MVYGRIVSPIAQWHRRKKEGGSMEYSYQKQSYFDVFDFLAAGGFVVEDDFTIMSEP